MPNLGVCSWSLLPRSPEELTAGVRACGLGAVQLALDPLRDGRLDEVSARVALADAGLSILSGMIGFRGEDYGTLDSIRMTGGVRPDADWRDNLDATRANARLAERLGMRLVSFHAGFIPHDRGEPLRTTMLDRVRMVADLLGERGIRAALETGQEHADTLLDALDELNRPHVGVNFDPANMILYGMGDPVAALRVLGAAGRVAQIHVKDAIPTVVPGTWGEEVPVGKGAVDWPAFFGVFRAAGLECDLVIEREAGASRHEDIRAAAALVRSLAPGVRST